jgi:hypothetical protein
VTVPVTYPDPSGRFYGYDQWPLTLADGQQVPGTKLLVATVGRIASALLASQTGQFIGSKRDCVAQYRRHIHDEWTDLVRQVYELCRNQWGYRIPEDDHAQEDLRQLCRQTLGFENHFLASYKTHLLAQLGDPEPVVQLQAAEKFRQIVYADSDVRAALLKRREHAGEALQQTLTLALQQMQATQT